MNIFPTDEKLVARALAGDRNAFRTLVERHYRVVFRQCRGVLRRPEDAEDATQEVFLRAYNALGQYSGRGAFGGWLRRLTVNHCLNRAQSAEARQSARSCSLDVLPEAFASTLEGEPEAHTLRTERQEQIEAALQQLPAQQRTALALRLLEGLSYDEIAEEMGVPVNSVRSWIHRGREKLRDTLKEVISC